MISDKRILYLAHRFPYPPAGGAKVRAFHCLSHLAKKNEVTVAAPLRDRDEARAVAGLEAKGVEVLAAPISRLRAGLQSLAYAGTARPASMGYFRSPELVRKLRRWTSERRPDLIIVHSSSVAPYVERLAGIPKLLDFVDMDSRKWRDYAGMTRFPRALVYRREAVTLERAERRLARAFDCCLVATEHERESLAEIAGDVASAVVRNGVDLDYFAPGDEPCDPNRLCFVGRMDYYPNEQAMEIFCRRVWPRIRAERPAAALDIVGASPTPRVRALGGLEGVTVTGTVEDVRPYVRRAAATVAPLAIARGTQNKILESMALGVPVIASPVAAKGVDAEPGTHLLVADGEEETAKAALRLMNDGHERDRLARAGRALAEERYAWSRTLEDFDRAVEMVSRNSTERDV